MLPKKKNPSVFGGFLGPPKRSPLLAEVLKSSNCSSKVVEDVEMIDDNLRI